MATILVIILRVNRPNFMHFRIVNAQKPSPKGEAAAWSAYSWIRACLNEGASKRIVFSLQKCVAHRYVDIEMHSVYQYV